MTTILVVYQSESSRSRGKQRFSIEVRSAENRTWLGQSKLLFDILLDLDELIGYRASLDQFPSIASPQLANAVRALPNLVRENARSIRTIERFVVTPKVYPKRTPESIDIYAFHSSRTAYAAIDQMLPFLTTFYDEFRILPIVSAYPRAFSRTVEILDPSIRNVIRTSGILFDREIWR
jgi:hypothetical protein